MGQRLLVATRKGLFFIDLNVSNWGSITHNVFLGDPVSMTLCDVRSGYLYAALNLGHFGVKLHRSQDDGKTWEECAVPEYPKQPEKKESEEEGVPWKLTQIWSLETGGKDRPDTLWAGTHPGGLFRSDDNGNSWNLIQGLWNLPERKQWMGGGYDEPGIHSICVDPRNSEHVAIGVSVGGVWVTQDGGSTWSGKGKGMRAAYMPPEKQYDPVTQDPHRLVQCPSSPDVFWVQHHNGIFRSVDGSESWKEITNVQPSTFGFAVAVHPNDPNTAWFVPGVKDECRIPVNGQLVVTRTRDGGKRFDILKQGLPQDHAYDLVYRHALTVDETGNRLAMGSTTGSLWISDDQGDSWKCLSTHLPPIYCLSFIP